jgi:polysaccharide export outer membrane protein
MAGDLSQNLPIQGDDFLFVPRTQEIYLMGEVKKPGALDFEAGLTLLEAIAKSGGFTRIAQQKRVQVVRMEEGKEVQHVFNMKRIARGKDPDFALEPEDLIVVPESIL